MSGESPTRQAPQAQEVDTTRYFNSWNRLNADALRRDLAVMQAADDQPTLRGKLESIRDQFQQKIDAIADRPDQAWRGAEYQVALGIVAPLLEEAHRAVETAQQATAVLREEMPALPVPANENVDRSIPAAAPAESVDRAGFSRGQYRAKEGMNVRDSAGSAVGSVGVGALFDVFDVKTGAELGAAFSRHGEARVWGRDGAGNWLALSYANPANGSNAERVGDVAVAEVATAADPEVVVTLPPASESELEIGVIPAPQTSLGAAVGAEMRAAVERYQQRQAPAVEPEIDYTSPPPRD